LIGEKGRISNTQQGTDECRSKGYPASLTNCSTSLIYFEIGYSLFLVGYSSGTLFIQCIPCQEEYPTLNKEQMNAEVHPPPLTNYSN
jgi:hypothetical protein